jgi:hypothetical protein
MIISKTGSNVFIMFYLNSSPNLWLILHLDWSSGYKLVRLIFLEENFDPRRTMNGKMSIINSPLSASYFHVFHLVIGAPICSGTVTNIAIFSVKHKHLWRNQSFRHIILARAKCMSYRRQHSANVCSLRCTIIQWGFLSGKGPGFYSGGPINNTVWELVILKGDFGISISPSKKISGFYLRAQPISFTSFSI